MIDETTKFTIDQTQLKKANGSTQNSAQSDFFANDEAFLFLKNSRKKSGMEVLQKDSVKNIFVSKKSPLSLKVEPSSAYVNLTSAHSLKNPL